MKIFVRILIYLSMAFVAYYLYQYDYFQFNEISLDFRWLGIAVLLLWAGFFFSGVSWKIALKVHGIQIRTRSGVVSHGLSIFAKYIPGKVWTILGRASFVAVDANQPISVCGYISLKEQLTYLWLGMLIGIGPMIYFYPFNSIVILVMILTLALTFFLFSEKFHGFVIKIIEKIIKRKLDIPLISFSQMLPVIRYVLVYWGCWLGAFYFFIDAFQIEFSIGTIFCWPLSISLGVMALVIPGGIGVREGFMTGFMVLTGIPLETATTIAVASRLWFITGEIFMFILSLSLNRFNLRLLR